MFRAPVKTVLSLLLCAAISLMPMGCATSPAPMPEEHYGEHDRTFYRVAVISMPTEPEIALRKPWGKVKGTFIGIGKGALEALNDSLEVFNGSSGDAEVVFIAFTVIYTIAGPIYMIKGGIDGARQSLPGGDIEEYASAIGQALERTDLQVLIRDEVVTQLTARDRELMAAPMDNVPDGGYTSLRALGYDTVCELSILHTGLLGDDGADPPLTLFMDARLRLIRTVDNTVIFDDIFSYAKGEITFAQWAMQDAHAFTEELGHAIETIASKAITEAFDFTAATGEREASAEETSALP